MRKNNKIISCLLYLILGAALIFAAISGYKVITYYSDYAKDRAHYEELRNDLLETVPYQEEKEDSTNKKTEFDWKIASHSDMGEKIQDWMKRTENVLRERMQQQSAVPLESRKDAENTEGNLSLLSFLRVWKKMDIQIRKIQTVMIQSKIISGLSNWIDALLSVLNGSRVQAPLRVDWEELKAINPDIIAWLYFTGLPQISYPVLQAEDNAYYVNRTYDLSSDTSKAGSIFMDYRMEGDFSSPYSIIYGHNVRDGSMLSDLPLLKNQELYESDPYFWILTPDGDYKYRVFSIFQCHRSADVFQRNFLDWGEDFNVWQTELQSRNVMDGNVRLKERGHVIVFSTCVPNSFDRTIVCGTYMDGDGIPAPHPELSSEESVAQPN